MAQLINEARRMQVLAGLITESQLNEAESALLNTLKSKEKYLKDSPENITKKITDYLKSIIVVADGKIPGSKVIENKTYYLTPWEGKNIKLQITAIKEKGKITADQSVLNGLVKIDPYLSQETANEVMKTYLEDQRFTEDFGGFNDLGILDTRKFPNHFNQSQAESLDIESTVNEALIKFRKTGK
jgi:hypothetical protein